VKSLKLALGLILVILGILLVTGNLTMDSFHNVMFNLSDFWPMILIFVGLGILSSVKGFHWVKYVNNILIALFVLFLFFWPSGIIGEGEFQTSELLLENPENVKVEAVEIYLKSDVLTLTINNLSGVVQEDKIGDVWYSVSSGTVFDIQKKLKGDRFIITLNVQKKDFLSFIDKSKVVLNLNPAYKYIIYTKSGVFKTDLDLSGLTIKELNIESGILEFSLNLSQSIYTSVTLKGGVIKGEVNVPEGVKLTLNAGTSMKKIRSLGVQEHRFDSNYIFGSMESPIESTLKIDAGILDLEVSR